MACPDLVLAVHDSEGRGRSRLLVGDPLIEVLAFLLGLQVCTPMELAEHRRPENDIAGPEILAVKKPGFVESDRRVPR